VSDTTCVVLVPESGDGIQMMKAGLMEIADIYVVNKTDRPGADRLRQELEVAIGLKGGHAFRHLPAHHGPDHLALAAVSADRSDRAPVPPSRRASGEVGVEAVWEPPVIATAALRDEGIAELAGGLDRHFSHLERGGDLQARRARQLAQRTRDVLERALRRWLWSDVGPRAALETALGDVAAGRRSPYEAAAALVERFRGSNGA